MNQGRGQCSSCASALPPFAEADGRVRCPACGTLNGGGGPGNFGVPPGGYGGPPAGYGMGPAGYGAPRAGSGCGVAGLLIGLGVAALLLVFVGGFAAFFLARKPSVRPPSSVWGGGGPVPMPGVPAPVATSLMQWEGVHGAILTDVNGDGVADVVGRARYVIGGDRVTLAAFEGATGKTLWESIPLGTYTDTYTGLLGLADDTLVLCQAGGQMSGWSVKDGTRRWTGTLPEKTKHLCKGDHAGEVRVVLADDTAVVLRLTDGHASAPTPAPKAGGTCVRLTTDQEREGDASVERHDVMGEDVKVDGMRGRFTLQRAGGPKIVLGYRAKGTAVPMIAALFADPSRDWKSDMPASRPLEASTAPWPTAALTSNRIVTDYRPASGPDEQLVAFDLIGRRLWETPVPDSMPLSAIGADDHRVFVSQWTHLTVLDASTGRTVYTIGRK